MINVCDFSSMPEGINQGRMGKQGINPEGVCAGWHGGRQGSAWAAPGAFIPLAEAAAGEDEEGSMCAEVSLTQGTEHCSVGSSPMAS